ncbi:hypothetical protein GCM10011607_28960 [Shewanella inventionis]|uniref:Uncharacterized protein n=1 Tax=Shewanella inventionis TaxID=1738770 RepID=A0ABQ1JDY8_9GAMM|nr:hypothetical protein [Shewanella inventionis]GGB66537.1 hypothetical protein GCM10011607_28960 [Shewanella inventionis]
MSIKDSTNIESRYSVISNNDDAMHPSGYHRIFDMKTNAIVAIIDDYALAKGLVKRLEQAEKLAVLTRFIDGRLSVFPKELRLEFDGKLKELGL